MSVCDFSLCVHERMVVALYLILVGDNRNELVLAQYSIESISEKLSRAPLPSTGYSSVHELVPVFRHPLARASVESYKEHASSSH